MSYSYNLASASGSTRLFTFAFNYLSPDHIHVKVDSVPVPFTLQGPYTVRISSGNPAAGSVVEIRRVTPMDVNPVDFYDGAVLTEADLDLSTAFALFVAQEATDATEGTLKPNSIGKWDGQGRQATNFSPPLTASDLVTRGYLDTIYATTLAGAVSSSIASATAAANSAATANSAASSASSSSTSASSSAATATGAASTATTKAGEAAASAATASTGASTATTKAAEALNSATTASAAASTATSAVASIGGSVGAAAGSASSAASSASSAAGSASSAASSASSAAASAASATAAGFGVGQALTDVTGSRASATTYTNTTGKPIFVHIRVNLGVGQGMNIILNGVLALAYGNNTASLASQSASFPVLPGDTYRLDFTGSSIASWLEVR